MLTRVRQARTRLLQGIDAALFALALGGAYALRGALAGVLGRPSLEPPGEYLWLFPAIALAGPFVLARLRFYAEPLPPLHFRRLGTVARAALLTVLALVLLLFIAREQSARSVIVLGGVFGGALVWVRDECTARLAATRLAREQWARRVLWVGEPAQNALLRAALTPAERAGLADLGDFDPAARSAEEFAALLHGQAVNVVVVNLAGAAACAPPARLRPLLELCGREGVSLVVRLGFLPVLPPGLQIDRLAGEAVLHYRAQAAAPAGLLVKRLADLGAAAALLVALSPLLALIAAVVAATSRGPVLFRQQRAGLNGRPFTLFKFRTMRAGAERERDALAARNEMRGPVFKLAADPRLTPPGRFLRRHGLDELPQLWNVLRGEMSLVGPRPLPLYEVSRFERSAHRRRLSVRPGLTCLWQVSGRNDIADFDEWVRLDLAYIDNWSLLLDAKILLATLPAILLGKGGR
ncbi:MAG: exopolysaccharide biosynthesis polyprenyl glycosylphosphotransferase [Opitutaceae bacterium]|jgi:exopolysaccharide biosynthesis polyprenyl glycosylphosphotransferase|nr:exopolysaccharide biosynthesis polyprenyl glycosylphosphotransferase [Opitutaceae bacterium]